MADPSARLDLIQRAVKRLAPGKVFAPGEPADDRSALPSDSDRVEPRNWQGPLLPSSEAARPQSDSVLDTPQPSPRVQSAEANAPAKIRFSEFRRRGMITPDNLRSNISFEFRAIKRKLIANARDQESNAITRNLLMVTSALPGEGKTFTATNLALALAAERDLHVLLIDADVLRPSFGTLFEIPEGPGLTDLLNGNCRNPGQVMHRCAEVPNLNVIFSGGHDERTPELISSQRTTDLLLEMSTRYKDRVIIFDTPPVLASSETASLAEHMHQVIMVVAAGQASHTQVRTALDHVAVCPTINLIFNKAPKWHKIDDHPYYYYYGNNRPAEK